MKSATVLKTEVKVDMKETQIEMSFQCFMKFVYTN